MKLSLKDSFPIATLVLVAITVVLLVAATAPAFLIGNAKLTTALNGNGQAITNVSIITLTNGAPASGTVTGVFTLGTGFNIFAALSNNAAIYLNSFTNGDSSISISTNTNTFKLIAQNITEAKQSLSDNTTANVSASAHGYVPKLTTATNGVAINNGSAIVFQVISNLVKAGTNIVILNTNGVITIHASGGSGGGSVPLTNTVWVAKNGDDSTGSRGDPTKAFFTLGTAKTNAVSGDTIFVMPGTWNEENLLKDGVNWHFFNGAKVIYTGPNDYPAIFDASSSGTFVCRISGEGEFSATQDNINVIAVGDSGSNVRITAKSMVAGGSSAAAYLGTGILTVDDALITTTNRPPVVVADSGTLILNRVRAINNGGTYHNGAALDLENGSSTVIIRDSVLQGNASASSPVSVLGASTSVAIHGTVTANLGVSGVTLLGDTGFSYSGSIPYNTVVHHETNTAPFTIDSTDFALDTNYTNGTQRAWVGACLSLTATNGANAIISLYLDQNADATFEVTGITAQLGGGSPTNFITTNIVQIGAWVQPGAVFVFTNLSIAPATAAVNAGSSQWIKQ